MVAGSAAVVSMANYTVWVVLFQSDRIFHRYSVNSLLSVVFIDEKKVKKKPNQ